MPNHGLETLRVGSYCVVCDCWNHHRGIRNLRSIAAVPAYDACNPGTNVFRQFERSDKIGTYVLLVIVAADREDKQGIALAKAASLQPPRKTRFPAVVVYTSGQLADIVCWRIAFDVGNLSKVVHGMGRVARI